MKGLTAVFLSLSLINVSYAQKSKMDDQTVMIDGQNQEMNAAIAQARATLDDFLKLAKKPPKGADGFKLKVMVVDGDSTEHLWVTPFRQERKGFSGVIVNEPELVSSVKYGEKYAFTRDQISDWGYSLDGKQKGSYTVCVLFKNMPPEAVQSYKDDYGFECNE